MKRRGNHWLNLDEVSEEAIDWRYKGAPAEGPTLSLAEVAAAGWQALGGDLPLPVLLLKDSALQHNIRLMSDYCRRSGVSLAPHTKTPLSPQIAARQLDAGAWGLTVATFHQARVLRHVGAQTILLANQLVERAAIHWVARELATNPAFQFICLVDSVAGAHLLEQHLSESGFAGQVSVLIELGVTGGRGGCRSVPEAVALANHVAGSKHLRLVGVETYENMFPEHDLAATLRHVDQLLDDVRKLVLQLDANQRFAAATEVIVSAGGSLFFDRVVAKLASDWSLSRPVRVVLRSGSYVTHDRGIYEAWSPLAGRAEGGGPRLRQALELWAPVLSRPEAELLVLGFGKRDAPYDRGLPIPFSVQAAGAPHRSPATSMTVLSLNDQHARVQVPATSAAGVGDLVGLHISHPCTSFDKFRIIPVVDDQYQVIEVIRCYL